MRLVAILALIAVALGPGARAEETVPEAQTYFVYDFAFESGQALPELRIAYDTRGVLSPARDNAILLVHGTTGDRHSFDPLIGPGKPFDTDRYFVIAADCIGGGDSSAPKDELGQDFPRYTVRDMMDAQYALVTRGLGLERLRAVAGFSMGAFVALEWGVHHPETVQALILLAPSPKTEPDLQLTVDLMTSVVALDPEWQGGRYAHNPVEGLRHAAMVYYPWTVSAPYLDRIPPQRMAQELEDAASGFGDWDANSLVWRLAATRGHDIAAPFGGDMKAALSRIVAPSLILASASDRLLGIDGARRIRDGIGHPSYAEIPSDLGHSAARPASDTPEAEFIGARVRAFLSGLK